MSVTRSRASGRMTASARREQLLDATTEIVVAGGFQAVSIESVAREAGVSRALVYEHFGELDGLLEAVVERETTRALAQVSETSLADPTEGDPQQLMLESLRAYLYAVRDHPTTWRLVLTAPEGAPELLRKSIERGRAIALARLAETAAPVLLHEHDAPDAELTARVLSAVADEYARLVLADGDGFPPERLLAHARGYLERASR